MKRSGRVDMPIGLRTLTVREEALGWRVATEWRVLSDAPLMLEGPEGDDLRLTLLVSESNAYSA